MNHNTKLKRVISGLGPVSNQSMFNLISDLIVGMPELKQHAQRIKSGSNQGQIRHHGIQSSNVEHTIWISSKQTLNLIAVSPTGDWMKLNKRLRAKSVREGDNQGYPVFYFPTRMIVDVIEMIETFAMIK